MPYSVGNRERGEEVSMERTNGFLQEQKREKQVYEHACLCRWECLSVFFKPPNAPEEGIYGSFALGLLPKGSESHSERGIYGSLNSLKFLHLITETPKKISFCSC